MLGEAAELQGVQLLGDLLCPATVDQLSQLEWSPVHLKTQTHSQILLPHVNKYKIQHMKQHQLVETEATLIQRLFDIFFPLYQEFGIICPKSYSDRFFIVNCFTGLYCLFALSKSRVNRPIISHFTHKIRFYMHMTLFQFKPFLDYILPLTVFRHLH